MKKINFNVRWIEWVMFLFSWLCLLGSQSNPIGGFLGIWLVVLFALILILDRINDLEKNIKKEIATWSSSIITTINYDKKEQPKLTKKKTVFKCNSCKFFAQDKYGRFCNAHMLLFRARCHKFKEK